MDYKQLASQFCEEGYLAIDNFFDAGLMDKLDHVIVEHFGKDPDFHHTEEFLDKSKTEVIPWFPQNDGPSAFDGIDELDSLAELTREILGADWKALYCMVMYSKQGTVGQAWHQDCSRQVSDKFNMNRLVYTRDIDAATGGQTVVVPGTHRRGELPPGDPWAEMGGQVVLEPRRGTLLLLHGHTWHRVLPVTGNFRFSTNYRSIPSGTPEDITDICLYRNMRYCFSTQSVVEERTA
jgi:hypothetical protein